MGFCLSFLIVAAHMIKFPIFLATQLLFEFIQCFQIVIAIDTYIMKWSIICINTEKLQRTQRQNFNEIFPIISKFCCCAITFPSACKFQSFQISIWFSPVFKLLLPETVTLWTEWITDAQNRETLLKGDGSVQLTSLY